MASIHIHTIVHMSSSGVCRRTGGRPFVMSSNKSPAVAPGNARCNALTLFNWMLGWQCNAVGLGALTTSRSLPNVNCLLNCFAVGRPDIFRTAGHPRSWVFISVGRCAEDGRRRVIDRRSDVSAKKSANCASADRTASAAWVSDVTIACLSTMYFCASFLYRTSAQLAMLIMQMHCV